MAETISSTKPNVPGYQLPVLPETRSIEPIVQCGVLYLGTAPSNTGLRGVDSIQEPFSHRYPVDGTNTVRGIDAVLSVYDNGLQLAFTRQPRTVVFFPINALIYCASLRFSIIKDEQTKSTANIDWRFMPLDTLTRNEHKHPPLFCAVVQRTHIIPGDECHCFITKNTNAAYALVRTISQVYGKIKLGIKCLKSPLFYQLDLSGRRLSEATGIVYLSPANDDESQLNRTNPVQLKEASTARKYLLDSSFNGYYYRTDASVIEQWQLWDDDDLSGSRPHPPDSPFGLHEGLYHDDTTHEIQRFLRHMDDEDHSCSCTCSSNASNSSSSISTECSRRPHRHRRSKKQKSPDDGDQFNASFSQLQTSSFEPVCRQNRSGKKKTRRKPIIIEKVLPKSVLPIPILHPNLPQQKSHPSDPIQDTKTSYIPATDLPSFSYEINKRGEKITKEGNRIVFMDVVRPNTSKNPTGPLSYTPIKPRSPSHRRRLSRRIPVIDMQTIEKLANENKSKAQRHTSLNMDNDSKDDPNDGNHLTTIDMLEILGGYFEDYQGRKINLNNHEAQSLLDHLELNDQKEHQRKNSVKSSTDSSKSGTPHRRSRSTVTSGPPVNYVERPSIPSLAQSHSPSADQPNLPAPSPLTDEKLNEYVSNIYGTPQSIKSTTSSSNHHHHHQQQLQPLDQTAVLNAGYMSAFRYMQSSINPNYIQQYRNAY